MGVNTTLPDAGTFRRVSSNQRGQHACEGNSTTPVSKIKLSGNKCGHDPLNFRIFHPASNHKPRPSLIQKASRLLPNFIDTLNKRSERREAIQLVLNVIIYYTDLITLHFCDGKNPLSLEFIASKTALGLKRVKRAVRDLVNAGYLTVSERFKKLADGSYCGLIAIKKLTITFFAALGITSTTLLMEQHRAIKRRSVNNFFQASPTQHRTANTQSLARKHLSQILAHLTSGNYRPS